MNAMSIKFDSMMEHISSIPNQLRIASDEHYEYSECFFAGGPTGTYTLKHPFNEQPNVQYRIDSVAGNSGASGSIVCVSPDRNSFIPGFAATDIPTSELTPYVGTILICPNASMIPVTSSWFDLTDSNGALYIKINTTMAAYANIQFRRKR